MIYIHNTYKHYNLPVHFITVCYTSNFAVSLTFMESNSDDSANSSTSMWSNDDVDLARYSLAVASVIVCVAAVILLVYKKLYTSFNYRLILYLLVASIINSVVDSLQMPFYWYGDLNSKPGLESFCQVLGYCELYCAWNMSFIIFFINVEIFVMVTYSHQLIKLEKPCTATCFILPCFIAAVPLSTNSYGLVGHFCTLKQNKTEQGRGTDPAQYYAWNVPGLIIAGIGVIMIIAAILKLAYKLYEMKSTNNPEREGLLDNRDQESHSKALKETIPLAIYSLTVLALLITDMLSPRLSHSHSKTLKVVTYIANILTGCAGGCSAGIFFIQFCVKFYCPKKRPRQEQGDLPQQPINLSGSDERYQSSFYTADDQEEGSK